METLTKSIAGLVAVVALLVALVAYQPVMDAPKGIPLPPEHPNPSVTSWIFFQTKTALKIAKFLSRIGFGEEMAVRRWVFDLFETKQDYKGLTVTETEADGVKVRVYSPSYHEPNRRGIVYFHGGGWAYHSINSGDIIARNLARRVGAVVMSVDFRMAPEHPFPIPLEDCLTVTKFFLRHAEVFGATPNRIALVGENSGGNAAAAVALRLRDDNFKPRPKVQALMYPWLQSLTFDLPSYRRYSGMAFYDTESVAYLTTLYSGTSQDDIAAIAAGNHTSLEIKKAYRQMIDVKLLPKRYRRDFQSESLTEGDPALIQRLESFVTNPYAFPLMAVDLQKLPTTYVLTAEYDVFRDEGVIYAKRLEKANVKVTLEHSRDSIHGSCSFIERPLRLDSGAKAMTDLVQFLIENL